MERRITMTFTLLSCHPFPIIIFLTPEKLGGYSLCATTAGLRWPFALIGSFKLALLALTLFGAHSNALALDSKEVQAFCLFRRHLVTLQASDATLRGRPDAILSGHM
jgi:hypothetical protein